MMGGFTRIEEQKSGSVTLYSVIEKPTLSRQELQFQQLQASPRGLPLDLGPMGPQVFNQQQLQMSDTQYSQQQATQLYHRPHQQQVQGSISQRSIPLSQPGPRDNQIPQQQLEMLSPKLQTFQEPQKGGQLQQLQNPKKRKAQSGLQPSRNPHTLPTQVRQEYNKRRCTETPLVISPIDTPLQKWENSSSFKNSSSYGNQQVNQNIHCSEKHPAMNHSWYNGAYASTTGPPRPENTVPQYASSRETPYFHYSVEFLQAEQTRLKERLMVEDAIVANMKAFHLKQFGSEAPEALGHVQCQDLYQNTLKQEMMTYRDEMSKYQRRSKALLELMSKGNFLGNAQFWSLVSQRSRELRGEL